MEAVAVKPARRPLRRVRPPSGLAALDLAELWAYRDLLTTLGARDVMLRYRQTALGVIWVLLQPIAAAGILTVVFGKIAGLDKGGKGDENYFLLTFAAQILFAAYSGVLTKSAASLIGNTGLVSKVYFPRLVLPISTVASSLIDFGVGLALLIPMMLVLHAIPGAPILTLPLWFALAMLMSLGWGLIASALMVSYRDVAYILPVVLQLLNFGSPVAWRLAKVPAMWLPAFLIVNPLAILLEGFRWSVFGHAGSDFPISWGYVVYAAIVSVGVFVAGAVIFRSMERRFADVI